MVTAMLFSTRHDESVTAASSPTAIEISLTSVDSYPFATGPPIDVCVWTPVRKFVIFVACSGLALSISALACDPPNVCVFHAQTFGGTKKRCVFPREKGRGPGRRERKRAERETHA
jgi:hypothetical protein